jgi:hypothetical protein
MTRGGSITPRAYLQIIDDKIKRIPIWRAHKVLDARPHQPEWPASQMNLWKSLTAHTYLVQWDYCTNYGQWFTARREGATWTAVSRQFDWCCRETQRRLLTEYWTTHFRNEATKTQVMSQPPPRRTGRSLQLPNPAAPLEFPVLDSDCFIDQWDEVPTEVTIGPYKGTPVKGLLTLSAPEVGTVLTAAAVRLQFLRDHHPPGCDWGDWRLWADQAAAADSQGEAFSHQFQLHLIRVLNLSSIVGMHPLPRADFSLLP